ncbi:exosome complex component RRP45A-like isoform X2 [Bidens hawaiensis]|uniref:exosome complex component RRP45A-like isoform X2 n=1 Tax=Bidens hawaiensis TaxID=980011 RepID=UPI00404ADA58
MEHRVANSLIMTVNEKKFIESGLLSDIRVDGRRPFDYRTLTIRFASEDGSSEVQLGQTQVIGFVTGQLTQPYRDRPNEGSFAIYTEFSPMADPSFEPGRPGETAIELGRIIDRGLRESRAVDTESLCVIAGKLVWSIRIDLHIIDNGGNLVDAANIAALAALSTFRRPECTLGGDDGQELIIHSPDEREPLPLILHHFPIAVTFGFVGQENTVTVIMQCLRVASVKAGDITSKIKDAVESYNTQRSLRKIKRHNPDQQGSADVAKRHMERLTVSSDQSGIASEFNKHDKTNKKNSISKGFSGAPASWDPYSRGIDGDELRTSLASRVTPLDKQKEESSQVNPEKKSSPESFDTTNSLVSTHEVGLVKKQSKTLKDAVKPKHKRKNRSNAS